MKIAFIFTDKPDFADVPGDERYRSYFEIPDAAKSLSDIQERIITIAKLIGQFTGKHASCLSTELDLKNYPIKQNAQQKNAGRRLFFSTKYFMSILRKRGFASRRSNACDWHSATLTQ